MDFAKRYPILTAIVAFCVVAFAAESFFLWKFNKDNVALERDRNEARHKAESIAHDDTVTAPTPENLAAAAKNADALKADLDKVKAAFTDTAEKIPPAPTSVPELLVDIEQYANDMQILAKQHEVVLPIADYSFGMAKYRNHAAPPPVEKVSAIFTQMEVLQYIMSHLMGAAKISGQEMRIISVLRQDVTAASFDAKPGTAAANAGVGVDDLSSETFVVDPAVTARVPGFVDTYAFQIKFVSYTNSLRLLLNNLKEFRLPLVVRSVKVEPAPIVSDRPTGAEAAAAKKSGISDTAKPVVTDNLSQFTLVIEYIMLPTPPPAEGDADAAAASATSTDAASAPASTTAN
ncbi:MAG TPA: Amuc_1100 family pilus-like protein [Opitutales bacterium]|jgi:hypothetical protein|nr:Amuc_1100 family pilus-like protein [Opitutales bacterium]